MDAQQYTYSIDKKISLSIVGAIVIQIAAGSWWLSQLDSRVGELEKGASQVQVRSTASQDEMSSVKERVLKLEMNLTHINAKLDEIKELIMIKTRK